MWPKILLLQNLYSHLQLKSNLKANFPALKELNKICDIYLSNNIKRKIYQNVLFLYHAILRSIFGITHSPLDTNHRI